MGTILEKIWIDAQLEALPSWQRTAYQSFSSMVAGDDENTYPCIPALQGFLSNNLRFSFIGNPQEISSAKQLADALREYGKSSRDTGKYASLVVFFETPRIFQDYDIEDYRKLFWSILNNISTFDKNEWPEDIPTDPSHHKWEFCFDGEPYFVFCATPAHKLRKSRHFPCLLMAFQPRWVFKEMNDCTAFGRKIKKLIRKRLVDYDGIPSHPDLKWYGQEDNHEWRQYFLSDDESIPSKCPFIRIKNKLSEFLK